MNGFVLSRQVSIVAAITSVLILWAIIVVPGGPAYSGLVAASALAVLLTAASRLTFAIPAPAALSKAAHGRHSDKGRTR